MSAPGFVGVVCLVLLVGVVAFFAGYGSSSAQGRMFNEYAQRASTVRALSQNIAKNAAVAVNGGIEAFSYLESAQRMMTLNLALLRDGNPQTRLSPVSSLSVEADDALNQMLRPWREIRDDLQMILDRRDIIVAFKDAADGFSFSVPRLQEVSGQLVDRLVATKASREAISTAGLMPVYAEQVHRNVEQMSQGGIDNITAEQRAINAIEGLQAAIQRLQDGDVRDAQSLRLLREVEQLADDLEADLSHMLRYTADLFRAKDAADNIAVVSDHLLSTSEYFLSVVYSEEVKRNPVRGIYTRILGDVSKNTGVDDSAGLWGANGSVVHLVAKFHEKRTSAKDVGVSVLEG